MAKIFITGSSDGLGSMAANLLMEQGHQVTLHARNEARAADARRLNPRAEKILIADLSNIEETKQLAEDVNAAGQFDAVIHNAGVYQVSNKIIFSVNSLAPYILTCLIKKPKRLVYLSSGMHLSGQANFDKISVNTGVSYSDSKFHDLLLALAVARKWPAVYSNAVDPGWVPTKMGGSGAPDDLRKGFETQAWLAGSDDKQAKTSGQYFYHQKQKSHLPAADDVNLQEQFLSLCEKITGVRFP